MKRTIALTITLMAACSVAAKTFDWPLDAPVAEAKIWTAYHGETVRFNLMFSGAMSNVTAEAIYYKTNGMDKADWFPPIPGTVFHPTNDCGAAEYRFFIKCSDPDGNNYTPNGTLRLLDSPGFTPNTLPLPVATLDFAQIAVLNPPWSDVSVDLTPATNYTDKATNAAFSAAVEYTDNQIAPVQESVTSLDDRVEAAEISLGSAWTELWDNYQWRQGVEAALPGLSNRIDNLDVRLDNAEANIDNILDSELPDLREAIPSTAAEVHAYPDASGEQLAQQVSAIGAHINGEDAKVMITNYNSSTHLPEAEFHINASNNWLVIWREMTRWNWFLNDIFGPYTNAVARALANKSEKEYAFFDGVTGEPAPDGFFWISQPRVALCAGAAYQRYVDTAGEVWVLESNGMVADINGTTNGYIRISDDQNNVQFEIVKGNSRTVTAAAGTVTCSSVMGVTHWHTTYMVTNAVSAPKAMFCRDLANPEWYAEDDSGCPCNVAWTHPAEGIYVCEWWPQSGNEPRMFMRSQYGQGSESRIIQNAPVEMQYIVLGGTKYALGTATIDGKTVLTLSTP